MRCEFAHDDGAYVLGALAPAERANFEQHLAGCRPCRNAVAELAVLPGLLSRLDPDSAEQMALEADEGRSSRLPRMLAAARTTRRRERFRQRWQVAGAVLAAACLAAVVGVGVSLLDSSVLSTRPPVEMAAMVSTANGSPVTADVGFAPVAGGTKVWMHCRYAKVEGYQKAWAFRLVAFDGQGREEQVGSWMAGPGDDIWLEGITRYDRARLDRLELRGEDGRVLLTYTVA